MYANLHHLEAMNVAGKHEIAYSHVHLVRLQHIADQAVAPLLQAYSKAADVFSFGVILWELITWQMPWEEMGVFQVGTPQPECHPGQTPHTQTPSSESCMRCTSCRL